MDQDINLPATHLSAGELAAYLEQVPDGRTRHGVEAHLASCDACLRELIAAGRVLRCHREGPG